MKNIAHVHEINIFVKKTCVSTITENSVRITWKMTRLEGFVYAYAANKDFRRPVRDLWKCTPGVVQSMPHWKSEIKKKENNFNTAVFQID